MLKIVYCLFKVKPEEISGFANFVKQLEDRQIQVEMLETDELSWRLSAIAENRDCILITDMPIDAVCDMPIAGFLTRGDDSSLNYKYLFESFDSLSPEYAIMVYSRFYGLPLEILETERLRVREMTLDDVDRLYEIYAAPSITEYMEGLYPDKKDELEFAKSYIENMYGFYGYGLWIVIEKATGEIIGRAGLGNREVDGEICMELGYVIAEECQVRGYATEVCLAILDYARTELEASQVIALIRPGNKASIRTAEKLGFREVCEVVLGDSEEKYIKFCREL